MRRRSSAPRTLILATIAAVIPIVAPVGFAGSAEAEPAKSDEATAVDPTQDLKAYISAVCAAIETEAERRSLPPAYFARLIWKESRFDPNAVSPKGASGIAQFMPETARERGLADPFEPMTALAAAAAYLQDLMLQFGNLGLAAAAYNAGPARLTRWLGGSSSLPWETRDFVLSITGLTAEQWKADDVTVPNFDLHEALPFSEACRQFASRARPMPRSGIVAASGVKQWGVLIASHFTEAQMRAALERLRDTYVLIAEHEPVDISRRPNRARGGRPMYEVLLGVDDRGAGNALCERLRRAGGACIVVRK